MITLVFLLCLLWISRIVFTIGGVFMYICVLFSLFGCGFVFCLFVLVVFDFLFCWCRDFFTHNENIVAFRCEVESHALAFCKKCLKIQKKKNSFCEFLGVLYYI